MHAWFRLLSSLSPPLGLDVVHVQMFAQFDRRDRAADIGAVLDHRVVVLQIANRYLVTDWNVIQHLGKKRLVLIHDPACQLVTRTDAFDYHHAYRIMLVMHYEVNHCISVYLAAASSSGKALSISQALGMSAGHCKVSCSMHTVRSRQRIPRQLCGSRKGARAACKRYPRPFHGTTARSIRRINRSNA